MRYQRYDVYKDSGVEWLGEIPEHWEVQKVKYLFNLITEAAPRNNDFELLSVYTDIGVKPRKELEERGNKASSTDGYWMVKQGDIIVNKLLAWMGAIGLSEYDGVTSPAYDVLRKVSHVDVRFYHYLFRSGICLSEFKQRSRGIMEMRLRLYFNELGQVFFPVPPQEEQKAIADFIDKKTSQIDIHIAKQENLIELLKERRTAIINRAVTRGLDKNVRLKDSGVEWLGEIPEHWEVKKLKEVASFINRGTAPLYTEKSDYKVVNQATFSKGKWDEGDIRFHSPKNKTIERGQLKENDILLASTGGGVLGKTWLFQNFKGIYIADSHITIIRDKKQRFAPKYLFYFFSIHYNLINGILSQGSTNQTELQKEWLRQFYLPFPPIIEQEDISKFIENENEKINSTIYGIEKEIAYLKEYRQSLISNAVTGKIRVI